MIRLVLALLAAALLGLAERALYPFVPGWLALRPLLPFLVLYWMSGRRSQVLAVAAIGGLFFDVFAVAYPDLAVLRLPLILLAVDAVQRQWLTNRSLAASLGLMVLARLIDLASAWLVPSVAFWAGATPYSASSQPHLVVLFFGDLLLVALVFIFGHGLGRRFRGATYSKL